MTTNTLTLKPSFLIGASIARSGGLTYTREQTNEQLDGEHEIKEWQLKRDVPNLTLLKEADAIAADCRRILNKVTVRMGFGRICPEENEQALENAFKEIRDKVHEQNMKPGGIKLSCSFVRAKIVTDDQEAAKAVGQDIAGFVTSIQEAIAKADAKQIKQTVLQMKGLEQLLPGVQSEVLTKAMDAAKAAAKTIAEEVQKKGRLIEEVRGELLLMDIDAARMAFVEVESVPVQVANEAPLEKQTVEA